MDEKPSIDALAVPRAHNTGEKAPVEFIANEVVRG